MLAVKVFEVAWPLDLVTAVAEVVKVPEAPVVGSEGHRHARDRVAVLSVTVATRGLVKAVRRWRSGRCPRSP